MAGRVTIAGALAQRPGVAGHAAVFVHWLLGFRRLGWDVLFVDRLEPALDEGLQARWLADVLDGAGLSGCWSGLADGGAAGRSRREVAEHIRTSDLLIDVMGYLGNDVAAAAKRRVFLDIDPGFPQMWRALGLHDAFAGYDDVVTVGTRVGEPDCGVPTGGLRWITTLPPVDLASWPVTDPPAGGAFTSVATWRGPFGPVDFDGHRYGLRVHEFRRFLDLPQRTRERLEVALSIDAGDEADRDALIGAGWTLTDPAEGGRDLDAYRAYIGASRAELTIAKGMYVDTRSGWFSDRSACYLASGRPVVAQDTGFGDALPAGDGLLAFSTPDEALAGVEAVAADTPRHARAARALAEEHLDAPRVVERLLRRLDDARLPDSPA